MNKGSRTGFEELDLLLTNVIATVSVVSEVQFSSNIQLANQVSWGYEHHPRNGSSTCMVKDVVADDHDDL